MFPLAISNWKRQRKITNSPPDTHNCLFPSTILSLHDPRRCSSLYRTSMISSSYWSSIMLYVVLIYHHVIFVYISHDYDQSYVFTVISHQYCACVDPNAVLIVISPDGVFLWFQICDLHSNQPRSCFDSDPLHVTNISLATSVRIHVKWLTRRLRLCYST